MKAASLTVVALAFVLICSDYKTVGQVPRGNRWSSRCLGSKPSNLTSDERKKALRGAQGIAKRHWTVLTVEVHKCKTRKLTEVRIAAKDQNNHLGHFWFFDSHKSFRKAMAIHAGLEVEFEYTPIDQDLLWSEGEDLSFVKFLRISLVE